MLLLVFSVLLARNGKADHVRVFDADVHIHEHDADLAPYMEEPWRRVLEGGATRGSGRDVGEERFLDVPGYHPLTQYDPNLGDYPPPDTVRLTTADGLREDMDARGVDAALLFTGRFLRAATSNDAAYCAALGRAYNRYLQEHWIDPKRGIYGAIMAVNQAPEEATEEIERCATVDGFIAVYLPGAGNYPLWGDRMYDPIFGAAERHGLPVIFQGAVTIHTVFPYQLHHMPTALAKQAISQPFGAIANLVSMVTTGVLSRFPRLRIVFNDAGLAWLPMIMERLDHVYPLLREETPF